MNYVLTISAEKKFSRALFLFTETIPMGININ